VHDLRRAYHRLEKLFWTHQIEHLGDVRHVESNFGPFRDSVSISVR
jgi:hypothetical protein